MNSQFARASFYFAVGVFATGVPAAIQLYWKALAPVVLGRPISAHHLLPEWWKSTSDWLLWLPLGVAALLVWLRLARKRNILFGPFIVGAIAPYVAIYGVLIFGHPMTERIIEDKFDRHIWASHRPQDPLDNRRLHMARDLISEHLKVGMSTAELHSILGSPDIESGKPVSRWDYLLGPYPHVSLDESDSVLVITIGSDGKAKDFMIKRP